jgi:hypothetical protein
MDGTGTLGRADVLLARWDWKFLLPWFALAGALLVGAVVILAIGRWRRRATGATVTTSDQLTHFRELHEQGVLTDAEFEQIKAQLAGKLREELKPKAPPPGAAPPPEVPPVPPPPPDGFHPG